MSLASDIVAWCRSQEFWPALKPLLDQRLGIVVHVPFAIPIELVNEERRARQHLVAAFKDTGGALVLIEPCMAPMWHLQVIPRQILELKITHDDRTSPPDRKPAHAEDWN